MRTIGSPRPRLLSTALLLALCSLALTGCFRVELSIRVNEDGSGVFSTVMAFEDSFAGMAGETPEGGLFGLGDIPLGAVVEEYSQDGFTGQRVSIEVSDMEQLQQLLAGDDDLDGGVGELELAREGDGWRFSMMIPPPGEALADEVGDEDALDQFGSFLANASYTVRLALPGEIADHNADRVEDDELVWDLDLTSTEPRTFSARSQPPGGLSDWAILAIGIAGAVALIAVVILLARRSHRTV